MFFFLNPIFLEQINIIISIATPVILIVWFYYSQKQTLARNYFSQIDGVYAGFTNPVSDNLDKDWLYAGIVMNITNTDNKGYFKGQFTFGETQLELNNNKPTMRQLHDGIHMFLGKLDFQLYIDQSRHPFKPRENRTYTGTLYIIDRFDFPFEVYTIESFLSAEYVIKHYREMQTLVFTLKKNYRNEGPVLPETFTLQKRIGVAFEPYNNVKEVVFSHKTSSDI